MTENYRKVEINEKELVARMIEAAFGVERPKPGTEGADSIWNALNPEVIESYRAAAQAAVYYVYECMNEGEYGHTLRFERIPPPQKEKH